MPTIFGWIEIVAGIVSLLLVGCFFIELLRSRISLRRLRGSGWL
ncbi:hypothetical protein [Bosea beijingensis]|jgi:hypothetical protein